MFSKWCLGFFCFLLAGCVTVEDPHYGGITNAAHVEIGMSKREVVNLMGDRAVIGYHKDSKTGSFVPSTVPNPQRREKINHNGATYEVYYYFTKITQADGKITNAEMTPFVFKNGLLVGKDWDFLGTLK